MKAVRVNRFGGPDVMEYVDVDVPVPEEGEVLVRVQAAGVGPWDGWIRSGQSKLVGPDALPVTLGSDIVGSVCAVGPGTTSLALGDEVFGVTNAVFTGGYAEFAIARIAMIAKMPVSVSYVQAASIPVVAVTAWQMLFDHARLRPGDSALILGASGNVGGYAVQLASARGIRVFASGASDDSERLKRIGAHEIVNMGLDSPDFVNLTVDAVIDTVGGPLQQRSVAALRPGGVLVSAVSVLDETTRRSADVRSIFFYVDVNTKALDEIARLIDANSLVPRVGVVLPLSEARVAHEILGGTRKASPGKIVLAVAV
jgi:NADPH:quinone reductase-like Zn-dependent oxidoreductase